MARRSWRESLAGLFGKDISREVQKPQRYFERSRRCMEYAKRMTSTSASTSLQFNPGQCAHLANKLEVAVQSAEACALLYSPEVTAESVEIAKLLCRCAKAVETIIESCRKENWIRAAMLLSNSSEHVSALSVDLDFCTILLRNYTTKAMTWQELAELDVLVESVLVRETVLGDQRALLSLLEAVNRRSDLSADDRQLFKYLSGRLKHRVLSGVGHSKVWEIDFSNLRQVHRLGSGSVGTVRKSTWLGVEVAEKVFYGTDHPGFRNEVEILTGLAHPNIVPLLGYAVDGSRCSIVMELMDGDLLLLMEEKLRRNPTYKVPFTTSEAVDMMLQSAEGMRYLHEKKVVHRDLKSQNILVKIRKEIDAEYVYAKVADFGLSKTKEQSSSYSNLTWNTGTSRWMAPELLPPGENDIRARTELRYPFKVDVYSFGMVCYEILTGKVPFSTISSLADIKQMVLKGVRPELPDQCLPDLRTLIHACWEPDASQRPSFVEICKRLRYMKYLHMRGDVSCLLQLILEAECDAVQRGLEEHADLTAREPGARQMESKAMAWRLAATAVRALTSNFTEMERIQGQRSKFRANMGGDFVAVWKLARILEASHMDEFEEQVLQLWKLNHENVVKMVGFRLEAKEKVVVFESAPLGSLRDILLHGEGPNGSVLTWMQRVKIAVGVARALDYLHGETPPVICGSIKSSNILMFDDDVAKIGDFALLQQWSEPGISLEADIRAPWAEPERAPELMGTENTSKNITSSRQGDIYGFGMLLLELLTGKITRTEWELIILKCNLTEDMVPIIIDRRISAIHPADSAVKMAALAALCVQHNPKFRPSTEILIKALQPLVTVSLATDSSPNSICK